MVQPAITIDIVMDPICPWCFVGKRHLDAAIAELPGVDVNVVYRPYFLDPNTPKDGVDRKERYQKKFGDSPAYKQMRAELLKRGAELSIEFNFDKDCRIAPTLDAHRLLKWAKTDGKQSQMAEAIMQAYFRDAAFLGDIDLLTSLAEACGMDGELVRGLLASDRDKDLIEDEVAQAQQMGITGVPFYIIAGKYAVQGAQPADVLKGVIDKALLEG